MIERKIFQRPVSAEEVAVIRAALERAALAPEYKTLVSSLSGLRVVGGCGCGCDSVDFQEEPFIHSQRLADALGDTPKGGRVGVMVWGTPQQVTGLEIYDLGAGQDDLRLPLPVPWEEAEPR